LLEDLYRLTLAALGGSPADTHTVLTERKEEAARLTRLVGLRDDAREAFWNQLDVAYFLRHDASDSAWHTRHLYYQVAPDSPVVRARPTEHSEGLQIMVYTRDVAELVVAICGYFDAKALSIQDARIHTTRHGWALDSFIVLPPEGTSDLRAQATLIEHELTQRLRQLQDGTSASATYQVAAQRRQSRISKAFPVLPQAELQPDERSQSWRLSVTATDRPGLLHALTRVFASHGVSVSMAKIMTLGDRVEDVFILTGSALERPRTQMQFERAVLDALAGDEARQQAA